MVHISKLVIGVNGWNMVHVPRSPR